MSFSSSLVRITTRLAAVAVFAWVGSSTASAADVSPPPPPPVVGGAAPMYIGEAGGCPTCGGGVVGGSCTKCGGKCAKVVARKGYYPVNLCPGACFGYFQTQWRKWDEVCPYPYLGHGVSDAPKPPAAVLNPKPGELTPPRPFDPKMTDPKKVGSLDIPAIPAVPGKFDR